MHIMTSSQPEARAEPLLNIRGVKVGLGPIAREHIPVVARWYNDFGVSLYSRDSMRPRPLASFEAEFEDDAKDQRSDQVTFLIYDLATFTPIGDITLRHIWPTTGTAELGVSIGEKAYWSKGYGGEAVTLMVDYGFSVFGLHNIMLTTSSYNERALRAYRRVGFREFGRRREAVRVGDRRYDTVFMDCLASEFTSPFPRAVPMPEGAG